MSRKKLSNPCFYVLKRCGKIISASNLFTQGTKVLVAVSGGFASSALLHVLAVRNRRVPSWARITLQAVFVRDQVHGSAEETERGLKRLCDRHCVPLHVVECSQFDDERWTPVPYGSQLVHTANSLGARVVCLGHTMTDRGLWILTTMLVKGELQDLPPIQQCNTVTFMRPMVEVIEDVVRDLVREDALENRKQVIHWPSASIASILLRYIYETHNPVETLRNICASPSRIRDDYLA